MSGRYGQTAVGLHRLVKRFFSSVTERCMSQVVRKRKCFREVFVNRQRSSQGPGDLRNFEAMRQTCAVIVALVTDKDLGLCLNGETPRNNSVPVALENRTCRTFVFGKQSTARRADDTHRARG